MEQKFRGLEKSIEFKQHSYTKWAHREILDYIYAHKELSKMEAIEQFRRMMSDMACNAKSSDANFMFSVAYDTASYILDLCF